MFALLLLCFIAIFFISIGYWLPALLIIAGLFAVKIYQLKHLTEYKKNSAINRAVIQKLKKRELNSNFVQTGLFSSEQIYHDK